jgi:anti-anti-sigma factor
MMLVDRAGDGILRVRFRDLTRITAAVAAQIKEQVGGICEDPCRLIELDLNGIHFIDAKGFETLVELSNQAAKKDITLRLCRVSDEAWELIDLMQLTQFFEIEKASASDYQVVN